VGWPLAAVSHQPDATERSQELAKVVAVKARVGPAAFSLSDDRVLRLIEITGSVGLCCDALCMAPWPFWLERFVHFGMEPRKPL
jgi:hypothetical protein